MLRRPDLFIEGMPANIVIADAAYDADRFRLAIAVIPNNPSPSSKHPLDTHLYAQRHLPQAQAVPTRRHPLRENAANYLAVLTT
jgi:transposase